MITLYQFTVSQFCEKARWALDHKGLVYHTENWLPGVHRRKALKVADSSQLPILRHGTQYIQGAANIINFLDKQYPTRMLTPDNADLKKQAMDWERSFDKSFGIHLRRFYYTHMLQNPTQLRRMITFFGPWYSKNIYTLMLPSIKNKLIQSMKLNALEAERSRLIINDALNKLDDHLSDHKYIVGEQFTRADLAAASLLAPLCAPVQHPYYQGDIELISDLKELQDKSKQRPFYKWVSDIYRQHRWEVKSSDLYRL